MFSLTLRLMLSYIVAAPLTVHISMDLAKTDWYSLWTYFFWIFSFGIWSLLFFLGGIFLAAIFVTIKED